DDENLETWGEEYRKKIIDEISENTRKKGTVAIVCMNFLMSRGIDAVRNEALELYKLLKRTCSYNLKFISIEKGISEMQIKGGLMLVPEKGAGEIIKSLDLSLCILCESTPNIVLQDNCSMLAEHIIFKLSGQNPLSNLSENTLKELIHFNDFGQHRYLVQSEKAADIMEEKGFRRPEISYPLTSDSKVYLRNRRFSPEKFTVGFASSPMKLEQSEARGVNLLCSVIKANPDIKFKILWRYENVELPYIMTVSSNCEIISGSYNMGKFYSEIDCIIIPYNSLEYNHACSLSAIEAMKNFMPVVCTSVSGVSEIVKKCGMGEIAENDEESVSSALRKIKKRYNDYLTPVTKQRLDDIICNKNITDIIEHEAEKNRPVKPVSLYEWNRRLENDGKYLVMGHKAMKEYYSRLEIAENYTQDRFTSPALKYFDFIERQNIGAIFENYFGEVSPLIIDVACGDGRITAECIRHGKCISADASAEMLKLVKNRFKDSTNPPDVGMIDVIADKIKGKYDAVTCFRYIRHFEYSSRKIIYNKFRNILTEDGILIFDVPNIDFELPLKHLKGWEKYNIYDVFFDRESITEELRLSGFRIKYMIPTGQGLMTDLPANLRNQPVTWTVGAVRI
ncbi:MAG: methyltransferase domain-containing protein, partial [Ruminococcus sp.]|nr:methyltransferase domain-containing protein [Ruminococcus sp.]